MSGNDAVLRLLESSLVTENQGLSLPMGVLKIENYASLIGNGGGLIGGDPSQNYYLRVNRNNSLLEIYGKIHIMNKSEW